MSVTTVKSNRRTDIIAGLATFTAMSYIIFTNPVVLEPTGMAAGPVLLWTCMIAFAASAVAGCWLGTPTAVACGMGLNLFLAQYADSRHVPWEHLLVTCGAVSLAVFLLSIAPARKNLIQAIPPQIFAAIKAGVGGLLVKVSITATQDVASTSAGGTGNTIGYHITIVAFLAGLATILIVKAICALYVKKNPRDAANVEILDLSSLILSVFVMIPVCLWLHLAKQMNPAPGLYWIWTGPNAPFEKLSDTQYWFDCLPFAIAVFFIMMMDIAGSPVEYLRKGNPGESLPEPTKKSIIERSLWTDSAFNIIAPLAGVSPVVYYAENHVGWNAGGRSGWTAATVAGGFLVFAVIGAISIQHGRPISEWIPKFAVMPALFFVGLMIIAGSFAQRFKPPAAAAGTTPKAGAGSGEQPLGRVLFFLPAAITVVVVTNTSSFDTAIAAGILSYALISSLPTEFVGEPESDLTGEDDTDRRGRLALVYLGAVVVLILNFALLK